MELLRVATAGSVDDGKSTLIGRLLLDSKQIFEDQLESVEQTSRDRGFDYVNLALLTDGLRAEREQGITIDVAYRYFSTPNRKFIIADTPGHVQYTRNMFTGASTADVSLMLIDVRKGVLEQSCRHAVIASLLRVRHLVVCFNKMDLVNHELWFFERLRNELDSFSGKLGFADLTVIPISALNGDNVKERSVHMNWYGGPTLFEHLENLRTRSDIHWTDPRFPVQYVIRPMSHAYHDYRGFAGSVAGGTFRVGDEVMVLPSRSVAVIEGIDCGGEARAEAFPQQSVTIRLSGHIDVSRGDMICSPGNVPTISQNLDSMVCWFSERPMNPRTTYAIKHTTRTGRCQVKELVYRLDVNTLGQERAVGSLGMNDIGRVHIRTTVPLFFDEYSRNRTTGSFILMDEATNDTVGAGMIVGSLEKLQA
jgi:bifunctional enzyme CysN/CysC